jgi:hypothetical protein
MKKALEQRPRVGTACSNSAVSDFDKRGCNLMIYTKVQTAPATLIGALGTA